MDFFEAMESLKDGEKVKLITWPEGVYIGVQEQDIKVFGKKRTKYTVINADETEINPMMSFKALVEHEWEIAD